MLAECDRCEAAGTSCQECIRAVLPGGPAGLGSAEHQALRVLADAGLIRPLRLPAASRTAASRTAASRPPASRPATAAA
jgi:hypothetical protein